MKHSKMALILAVMVLSSAAASEGPRLHFVATARQFGPVGYRDPAGAMSPDGVWLAYSVGRTLRAQRIDGGPVHEVGAINSQIRYIAWPPDSRHVAVRDREPDTGAPSWEVFEVLTGKKERLWPNNPEAARLSHLAWSPDGGSVAGVLRQGDGSQLWRMDGSGKQITVTESKARLSYPVWTPHGAKIACLVFGNGSQRVSLDCEADPNGSGSWDQEGYGRFALSADGKKIYLAAPNEHGMLDVWSRGLADGKMTRLSAFSRDAYEITAAADGRVLFKTQIYDPRIAVVPANGGPTRELATFLAETPSWDWTGTKVGFTYGNWRRVIDDFHYPDIAQHVGVITVGGSAATEPEHTVQSSTSEDQGMCWSPNGKWIAFHSHFGPSDDLWIEPADGSQASRQITRDGHETGWPRWSPDGKWLIYPSHVNDRPKARIYVVGMDQETGTVTRPQQEVPLEGFTQHAMQTEWMPDSETLVFESGGPPGKKAIYTVSRTGGRPKLIHQWDSEQHYSGIGLSPDGKWVAFVGPSSNGYFQIFRVPATGGTPEQITFDPTDKTQPSYSPDGDRIVFTVFSYESQFWLVSP